MTYPGDSDGKESACNARDLGLILGLWRSPGEENANMVQYSYLENSMDRWTWWWATVHGVAQSLTQLSNQHTHMYTQEKNQASNENLSLSRCLGIKEH